jgi:hypothetical protein
MPFKAAHPSQVAVMKPFGEPDSLFDRMIPLRLPDYFENLPAVSLEQLQYFSYLMSVS